MKKQILKTVYTLLCCIFLFIPVIQSKEKPLELQINPYTGAISGLKIPGDKQNMEWLVKTDGSQYAWIKEDYGWGLGYFTVDRDRKSLKREWYAPTEISRDGMDVVYKTSFFRKGFDRTIYFHQRRKRGSLSSRHRYLYPFQRQLSQCQTVHQRTYTCTYLGGRECSLRQCSQNGGFRTALGNGTHERFRKKLRNMGTRTEKSEFTNSRHYRTESYKFSSETRRKLFFAMESVCP